MFKRIVYFALALLGMCSSILAGASIYCVAAVCNEHRAASGGILRTTLTSGNVTTIRLGSTATLQGGSIDETKATIGGKDFSAKVVSHPLGGTKTYLTEKFSLGPGTYYVEVQGGLGLTIRKLDLIVSSEGEVDLYERSTDMDKILGGVMSLAVAAMLFFLWMMGQSASLNMLPSEALGKKPAG